MNTNLIPVHIAVTMDGNGRWATKRGLSRLKGHEAGAKAALEIIKYCHKIKVSYLTLYMFSNENWNRPKQEVEGLMHLLYVQLKEKMHEIERENICLKLMGDLERLPARVQSVLKQACELTKNCTGMTLILALSYSGRNELVRAFRKMAEDLRNGLIEPAAIQEDLVAHYLDTKGIPDPDLHIRSGGEHRLSNYLLWQMAYTELYMTDCYWPDFTQKDLDVAIESYQKRERRFGLLRDVK